MLKKPKSEPEQETGLELNCLRAQLAASTATLLTCSVLVWSRTEAEEVERASKPKLSEFGAKWAELKVVVETSLGQFCFNASSIALNGPNSARMRIIELNRALLGPTEPTGPQTSTKCPFDGLLVSFCNSNGG